MATPAVAWLNERSPWLLGGAALVNLASASALALERAWGAVAVCAVAATLFGVAAVRFAVQRRRGAT